ncbi:MAG: hypothetical protein PWR29_1880, partial [Methanolobus sp.]|nr:hypothetical protein [Methanolobus sp.]
MTNNTSSTTPVPNFYRASAADFKKIPGSPIAYWVSERVREICVYGKELGAIVPVRQGLATADNDRFLRLWHEVACHKVGLNFQSREDARLSGNKWFPYNKGGEFRKWYGNNDFLINWENDGCELNAFKPKSVIRNPEYYFKNSITWSFVSSSYFGVRYSDCGAIFDVGGSSAFPREIDAFCITGLLCSKQTFNFMKIMNPTLNFQVGNVASIPFLEVELQSRRRQIEEVVKRLIDIARKDWDSYETSWDFTTL